MFQFCRRLVFATGCPDCIHYVGDTDICIGHLQHTEAEDNVEEMGAFEEDGALLIRDDADATFQERFFEVITSMSVIQMGIH